MTRSDDLQIWLTDVCRVCTRDLVRDHTRVPGTTRGLACTPCLRIDSGLGRLNGGGLLTPLDDRWARGDRVVHRRLRPDDDEFGSRLSEHHVRRVVAMSDAVKEATGRPPSLRYPGGPHSVRVVVMDRWQHHYPPGPKASAEGYVVYIEEVHPWALELMPLRVDLDVLVELGRGKSPQRI